MPIDSAILRSLADHIEAARDLLSLNLEDPAPRAGMPATDNQPNRYAWQRLTVAQEEILDALEVLQGQPHAHA